MSYPGGKNGSGVYQKIINMMPPHQIYFEGFLGGGAILRMKRPAPMANIAIDRDTAVIENLENKLPAMPGLKLFTGNTLDYLAGWMFTGWFKPTTLLYLDPPYMIGTRSSKREIYKYEMTDSDHERLLKIILTLPCMVMISGYFSELYADLLHGWRAETFTAQTRSGKTANEWVWMNFPEPFELHDYRFLGENFRDRERIKRKKNRWINRLGRMDPQERYALLDAISEFSQLGSSIQAMPTIVDIARNDGPAGTPEMTMLEHRLK